MKFMSEPTLVTFEVVAPDEGVEIFLIDGDFKLVERGIGRKAFSVTPGVYKIKARSGVVSTERLVVVQAGMPPVKLEPLQLNTAVPLLNSSRTHEFHIDAARHAADSPDLSLGSGSAIVIVARRWSSLSPDESSAVALNPARGVTLRDQTGAVIADVEAHTQVTQSVDPCVTFDVALNPGTYRLAVTDERARTVEQTLITAPGWETHIYLVVDGKAGDAAARVDLINSAITMRRAGEVFDPEDPALRREEIARAALRYGRYILSDDVRSSITSPSATPMLALIGAYLLIREANGMYDEADGLDQGTTVIDNRNALRRIVDHLRLAIGRHSDIEAVATAAGNPDPDFVFEVPPMFRASWPLLLKASIDRPDSIPSTSITAHVAERIWGEGVWLQWLDPGQSDSVDRAALWQVHAKQLLASMSSTSPDTARAAGMAVGKAIPGTWVSIAAATVVATLSKAQSLFARRSRTPFPDLRVDVSRNVEQVVTELTKDSAMLTDEQRKHLVERLGIPLSSINAWLGRLRQ
jgi:hypothetical protein